MLKVGLVGAGRMGLQHARAYKGLPVCLTMVYDSNQQNVQSLTSVYHCRIADHPEDIFSGNVDVVDVCSPTQNHCEAVIKAAEQGKHVFCEAPLAGSLVDAKLMVDVCKKMGVHLMVGHVLRFFSDYRTVKKVVEEGRVGSPKMVQTTIFGSRTSCTSTSEQDCILEIGIHHLDFLRWCFGKIKRIYGQRVSGSQRKKMDYALITLRFVNGMIGQVECGSLRGRGKLYNYGLEVAGDKGVMFYDANQQQPVRLYGDFHKETEDSFPYLENNPLQKNPFYAELSHFIDSISKNKEPLLLGEDGMRSLRVALAAVDSCKTGKPVYLEKGG